MGFFKKKTEESGDEPRKEQERTKVKKKMALEAYHDCQGIVRAICEKIDVSPQTFYNWLQADPDFIAAWAVLDETTNARVEQVLMTKIYAERDGASVRFHMSHKNPGYNKARRIIIEPGSGGSLEGMFDEDAKKPEKK